MQPVIGKVYERHNTESGCWHLERRKVLDVSANSVFYERIYPPQEDGTYAGHGIEIQPETHQVTVAQWNAWAKLAREET